jgi:heme-degrading monooxygenase HmoA
MHLRLSRFVGLAPERADEMVIAFEEGDYLDRLAEAPGFDGYLLAVDRGRGKITAMSFWQSKEDLAASDGIAEAARALRIAAVRPTRRPVVDRYEIVFNRDIQQFQGHLRLSRVADLAPAAMDAMVDHFEGSAYVDDLSSRPGYSGYLLAADRENGKVLAMSLWESQDALRASDHAAEEARKGRLAVAGIHDPIVDRYEIMLQR